MFRFDITADFDKWCEKILNYDQEKLRFIRDHERRQLVLSNLCNEVTVFESRFKGKDAKLIRSQIIEQVADLFIQRAISLRDLQNQSSAQKHTKTEYDKRLDAMEEIKGAVIEIDRSID